MGSWSNKRTLVGNLVTSEHILKFNLEERIAVGSSVVTSVPRRSRVSTMGDTECSLYHPYSFPVNLKLFQSQESTQEKKITGSHSCIENSTPNMSHTELVGWATLCLESSPGHQINKNRIMAINYAKTFTETSSLSTPRATKLSVVSPRKTRSMQPLRIKKWWYP